MQVGGVYLEGIFNVSEQGGMQAPSKKTEQGFDYSTFVESEPVALSVEAWVTEAEYEELADLRTAGPFSVNIELIYLYPCKLENLKVKAEAEKTSHYKVTIDVKEIRQPQTDTASITIESPGGSSSSSSDIEDASLVQPSEESSSNDSGGSAIGTVSDWLGLN